MKKSIYYYPFVKSSNLLDKDKKKPQQTPQPPPPQKTKTKKKTPKILVLK